MMKLRRHPTFRQLVDFADGSASGKEKEDLREHLADCSKCRGQVGFIWKVAKAARELPAPRPPSGMLEEILRRRAAGERVILPTVAVPPPPRSRNPVGAVVIVAILSTLAVSVFLLTSREASAGATEMRLTPDRPVLGRELEVELRVASPLAAQPRLRLRGRYRTAEEGPPRGVLGRPFTTELERSRGSLFRGAFRLPPSAVYAVLAVEDTAGARVETNGGRLWEVMAHDGNGRPLFAALRQKYRVLVLRNPRAALETARRMTELYPEHPEGWFYRLAMERNIVEPGAADSLQAFHRAQLARLDQTVSRQADPTADEMAGLVQYARLLGETEIGERWGRRLAGEVPDHPVAIRRRVVETVAKHAGDPAGLLRALEAEWERSGPSIGLVAEQGFAAALRVKDPDAGLRWADRYARLRPVAALRIARDLATVPALRAEAMARLRRELGRLEGVGVDARPLDRSVRAQREVNAAEARQVEAVLGKLLVESGRVAAGLDTLSLAAARGWDPALFRTLAGIRVAAGDTAGARWLSALAAVDPLAGEEAGSLPPEPVGAGLEAEKWTGMVRAARKEMRRRILERSDDTPLPSDVTLTDAEGVGHPLDTLVAGRVTLLVYWSRFSYPSRRQLRRLPAFAEQLERAGVRLLTVTDEEPSAELSRFLERRGYAFPVFHDTRGDATDAFGAWETPRYVVVDELGRVRFRHADLEEAIRQAVVLGRDARDLDPGA